MILGRVRLLLFPQLNTVTLYPGTRTSIQVYDVAAIMSGAACEPIAQFILPFDCKVKRAAWGPLNDSIYLACDDGFVRRFGNPIQVSMMTTVFVTPCFAFSVLSLPFSPACNRV